MNKTNGILAFLMLCTSISVFGQFHTITKQSKFYHIERITEKNTSREREITNKPQSIVDTPQSANLESVITNTPSNTKDISISDSLRQQYINHYLSVSFPMKRLIINSPFGIRKDPFTGKKRNHNGLDLHASADEVYAMLSGTIKKTSEDKRSGKYIVIEHGDFLVSYCHLSHIWVEQGERIKPGEVVGITGNTGRSTGEHLHITCKHKGKYVNPGLLLQFVRETQQEAITYLNRQ